MHCPRCGQELVEVDNPFRREVRHRRGVVCIDRVPPKTPKTHPEEFHEDGYPLEEMGQ